MSVPPFDAWAMFADAACVGNKLGNGSPETSALEQTFHGAELPQLAYSVEKLSSCA
jgi:hypothetical protein